MSVEAQIEVGPISLMGGVILKVCFCSSEQLSEFDADLPWNVVFYV